MKITDEELERHRLFGEIILMLKHSDEQVRDSLLTAIEQGCGLSERQRLEQWIEDGMPGA
jgi:hypothetical protein